MPRPNVKNILRLMPLLPALLLAACATTSPPSVVSWPQLPPKPAMRQPMPLLPYSASARIVISDWQKRLTATQTTPSSAATPGRSE